MNRKQFVLFLIVAFAGGIIGGMLSEYLFSGSSAFATNEKGRKVIEANEFRVVDDAGKKLASFQYNIQSYELPKNITELLSRKPTVSLEIYDDKKPEKIFCMLAASGLRISNPYSNANFHGTGMWLNKGHFIPGKLGDAFMQVDTNFGANPSIRLYDGKKGDPRLKIQLDSDDGTGKIELIDENDQLRAVLGKSVLKNIRDKSMIIRHEGSIVIFDDESNVLWKAP